jgi:hypothetical protein
LIKDRACQFRCIDLLYCALDCRVTWFCKVIFIQLCQADSFKFKDSCVAAGHGTVVVGKICLTFAQLYQQNQPQSNEGTMPFSFEKIKPHSGTLLRPAFAV